MQQLAKRAFVTYLKSVHLQKDREVFDVTKLPLEEFAVSLGLAITPKIRFINQKKKGQKVLAEAVHEQEDGIDDSYKVANRKPQSSVKLNEEPEEDDILFPKKTIVVDEEGNRDTEYVLFFLPHLHIYSEIKYLHAHTRFLFFDPLIIFKLS